MASLCGIDVRNFARKEQFWRGGKGGALDLRVEALLLLLMNLAQYVVDSTAAPGREALRRSGALSERFRVVAQDTRTFHAQNTRVAASRQFQLTFVKCFNEDLHE